MSEHASSTNSLTITRVFVAPRARVFDAWTNPDSEVGWWGPKDFTLMFSEKDLQPGGRWRMGMVRNGEEAVSGGFFREIVSPSRLVMTHAWEDDEGKAGSETLITITLAEQSDETEMVFVQTQFVDAAQRDGHRDGWNEAFDALAANLERADMAAVNG